MTVNAERSQIGQEPLGWRFWALWLLATTLGFAISCIVALAGAALTGFALALGGFAGVSGGFTLALALGGIAIGAMIGILQWLVIRRYLGSSGWWILASAAGSSAAFALGLAIVGASNGAWVLGGIVGGALGGAAVGALQWLLLRKQVDGSQVWFWIVASAVAWALNLLFMAVAINSAAATAGPGTGIVSVIIAGIIGALFASAITGYALMRIVRQSAS